MTYNYFPTEGLKLKDIDLNYHLKNVVRSLLIAILSSATESGIDALTRDERHFLYALGKEHLSGLTKAELREPIASVANLSVKAKEMWNRLTGVINVVMKLAALKMGFSAPEIAKFESEKLDVGATEEQLRFLVSVAAKFKFSSVYVLVDKVDENPLTGGAAASSTFIRPILSDLSILEMRGIAFKLFLWDRTEADAKESARPDKIRTYRLEWSRAQLKEMLAKRLQAHSAKRVHNLAQIVQVSRPLVVDDSIIDLSGGSPRNIIRICKSNR